ncbi:hypothetical protein [Salsipaludibacter albus]|uniref:hypothetical protein n=1 Tax=Salsipaludibacter albus TaxID=2849650 RepID=UPI001EE4BDEC|nr:hypothetical protein [Salsipaludibacter albus]MBY5161682.1 hypothetical protein [Salsipaludibacter albus]
MCLEIYVGSETPVPTGQGLHLEDLRKTSEVAEVLGARYAVVVSLRGGCACEFISEDGEGVTPEGLDGRRALAQIVGEAAGLGEVVLAGSFGEDSLRGITREPLGADQVVDLEWEWTWDSPRIFDVTRQV